MNKGILNQAETRLAASRKKAHGLRFARSLLEAKEIWSEFLTEHHRTFNRLGNAMDTPSERGWFDRLLNTRRDDAMLSYLHHARNADEHGRAEIVAVEPAGIGIGRMRSGPLYIENLTVSDGKVHLKGWEGSPGNPISAKFQPARLRLLSVVDRSAVYEVPTVHMGQPLPSLAPATLADLAVAFLEREIGDARQKYR